MVVSFLTRWRLACPAMAAGVGSLTKALLPARVILVALFAMPIVIGGAPAPSWPPATLRDTGLYSDWATKTVARDNLPFSPQYPLWSDGARSPAGCTSRRAHSSTARTPTSGGSPSAPALEGIPLRAPAETRFIERTRAGWQFASLPCGTTTRPRPRSRRSWATSRARRFATASTTDPVADGLPRLSRSRARARAGHDGLADVARSRSERAARRATGPWLARPHGLARAGSCAACRARIDEHAAANRGCRRPRRARRSATSHGTAAAATPAPASWRRWPSR